MLANYQGNLLKLPKNSRIYFRDPCSLMVTLNLQTFYQRLLKSHEFIFPKISLAFGVILRRIRDNKKPSILTWEKTKRITDGISVEF